MTNTRRNPRRSGSRKRKGGFIFQEIKNAANTVKDTINTEISKIRRSPKPAHVARPHHHPRAHVARPHQKSRHQPARVALPRKHATASHAQPLRNGTRKTGGRKSRRSRRSRR